MGTIAYENIEERVKMFLFGRWISTCYADYHLDDNMKGQSDEGYDPKNAICCLNRESGDWWAKQLNHFNDVVYPNYLENGTVENARHFLIDK